MQKTVLVLKFVWTELTEQCGRDCKSFIERVGADRLDNIIKIDHLCWVPGGRLLLLPAGELS